MKLSTQADRIFEVSCPLFSITGWSNEQEQKIQVHRRKVTALFEQICPAEFRSVEALIRSISPASSSWEKLPTYRRKLSTGKGEHISPPSGDLLKLDKEEG